MPVLYSSILIFIKQEKGLQQERVATIGVLLSIAPRKEAHNAIAIEYYSIIIINLCQGYTMVISIL